MPTREIVRHFEGEKDEKSLCTKPSKMWTVWGKMNHSTKMGSDDDVRGERV